MCMTNSGIKSFYLSYKIRPSISHVMLTLYGGCHKYVFIHYFITAPFNILRDVKIQILLFSPVGTSLHI